MLPGVILPPLIQLGVGRILLSWLPPGRLGGHRPIELPATLGASYLLGGLALEVVGRVAALLESDSGSANPLFYLLPFGALLLIRLATLPGYFVAGAEPPHEERSGVFWGLVGLTVLFAVVMGIDLERIAFACVASHLLWQGRRRPTFRAALILLFLITSSDLAHFPSGSSAAQVAQGVELGLAGGFLVPWVRRNDFRAAALSGLMLVSFALGSGTWLPSLGGLVLLGAISRPRQRPFAWKVIGTSLALYAVSLWLGGGEVAVGGLEIDPRGWILALVVLVGSALYLRRAAPWRLGEIEAPLREGWALTALLTLSVLFLPLVSVPLALMWAGMLLLPSERP